MKDRAFCSILIFNERREGMKENLINPVRRIEKPELHIEVKQGKDDLINIKADIKIKNPIVSMIKFVNEKIMKKD